ncbi:MAG: hypothetical protein JWO92_701 [Chitinophagaceae bacterium]|nr:hypothetical protein [Chitinophagaceae bacterium]
MGLYKYLHQERMEKGKYLLENTEKTLKEISSLLGYKYKENFNAPFKKHSERRRGNGGISTAFKNIFFLANIL